MLGDKRFNFIVFYRFPSQLQDQFESCKENFELNLESAVQNNPFLVVLPGDFNAKSSNWCKTDIITSEGKVIENIPSQFALHQVSNEPTHILESSSSCIDLIFTSQPNLITESGFHPSLHSNSHHQIIFAKFNLEFIFLSLYFRNTWHYQDANTDLVNTNVNEKVFILNRTFINILSNFIPHKTVTVDGNDPSWFTKKKKKNSPKRKAMFILAIEIVKTIIT